MLANPYCKFLLAPLKWPTGKLIIRIKLAGEHSVYHFFRIQLKHDIDPTSFPKKWGVYHNISQAEIADKTVCQSSIKSNYTNYNTSKPIKKEKSNSSSIKILPQKRAKVSNISEKYEVLFSIDCSRAFIKKPRKTLH